ncbi:MAG: DUF4124 domain-containing protein [Lysobacterales bacterium]|jgi:hypothetical protein
MSEKRVHPVFGRRAQQRFVALAVVLAASLATTTGLAGTEVYTWTDADGVTHYTDSPPSHGKSKTIQVEEVYRPGTADVYNAPTTTAPSEDTGSAMSAAQQRREEINKKRQEAQAQQAEIDRLCKMHRDRLARVEPSRRVFYTDPTTGEQVRLDDEKRVAMVQESKDFISKNCK